MRVADITFGETGVCGCEGAAGCWWLVVELVGEKRGKGRGTDGWGDGIKEWVEGRWGARGETEDTGCHCHVFLSPLYWWDKEGLEFSMVKQRAAA